MKVQKEISFSKKVKEESSLFYMENPICYKQILSSFIKLNGNIIFKNKETLLQVRSENIKIGKLIISIFKLIYKVEPIVRIIEKKRLRSDFDNKIVEIEIRYKVMDILKDLHLVDDTSFSLDVVPVLFLKEYNDKKAYLTGAFLASGSINPPTTSNYHLEINCNNHKKFGTFLMNIMKKFYLDPKITKRRNSYIVYLKRSDQIGDFLKILNASTSLLEFEEIRIQRDQYNSINRLYNCEISNSKKILLKGKEQVEIIKKYKKKYGFDTLKEDMKYIANLRLKNPEASYEELSILANEEGFNYDKNAISYRLNKLIKFINNKES